MAALLFDDFLKTDQMQRLAADEDVADVIRITSMERHIHRAQATVLLEETVAVSLDVLHDLRDHVVGDHGVQVLLPGIGHGGVLGLRRPAYGVGAGDEPQGVLFEIGSIHGAMR